MIGEIAALSAAFFWAVTSILYKKGLGGAGLLPGMAVRTFWGMMFFLIAYLALVGADFSMPTNSLLFIVMGRVLRLVLGDMAYLRGLTLASVSRVVPLTFTFPLFTIILGAVFLHEPVSTNVVAGTLMIIAGTWSLSKVDRVPEKDIRMGLTFALLAAVLYAVSIIVTKAGLAGTNPFLATLMRMPLPVMIFFAGVALFEPPGELIRNKRAQALFALSGITGLGIGTYLFLYSLSLLNTASATSLSSITPLFSLLLAVVFLREKLSVKTILGILLTVGGVILVVT